MCGIFCALSKHQTRWPSANHQRFLENRGPDSCCRETIDLPSGDAESGLHLSLLSTVLSLRGASTVRQPYTHSSRNGLLSWNGEAWRIDGASTDGNDTAAIFGLLSEALQLDDPAGSTVNTPVERAAAVSRALSRVAGPYAFVFVDVVHRLVFFGRDLLGRRSLLTTVDNSGDLVISSVPDLSLTSTWAEVEAGGVYCLDPGGSMAIDTQNLGGFGLVKVPYAGGDEHAKGLATPSVLSLLVLNKVVPQERPCLDEASPSVRRLQNLLQEALSLRVLNIPDPPTTSTSGQDMLPARLAVLFSGGLDCTVLARMSHDLLPSDEPIDLLNVAFENPRIHKSNANGDNFAAFESCPDRITGRSSAAELTRVCPERQWRLVTINVPYTETQSHRQRVIELMHPHDTEMDLSISYALYFAARGTGQTVMAGAIVQYTTAARVLLSGLGADELFGGYQRHATAFSRHGYTGLLDELELDVGRLGKRNLGRDDRVISNWGREARFPYLDEDVLQWALAAPVSEKCGFGEIEADEVDAVTSIEPGKKVLRLVASRLGMSQVAREKKRAIQFGARTAKMETGKTKGTHTLT